MTAFANRDRLDEPVTAYARSDFVAFDTHQTVQEILDNIRTAGKNGAFLYFYVLDAGKRLVGVIQTRKLLTAPLDARADAIMTRNPVAVPDSFTLLDACELFVFHKFLAFPVVDKDKRIVGVIDVSLFTQEMFELEEREQIHNLFETLGVRLSGFRNDSSLGVFRSRFPWLVPTIISGTLCALVVGLFHVTLAKSLILASFLTLVLGLGESVSMQAMALTVHTLHHGMQAAHWYGSTLRREIRRTSILALACASIVGGIAMLWQRNIPAGMVIACGILTSLLVAAFLGVTVPVLLHRLRLDLRVASGPATLALTDICTILAYFSLAAVMIR